MTALLSRCQGGWRRGVALVVHPARIGAVVTQNSGVLLLGLRNCGIY